MGGTTISHIPKEFKKALQNGGTHNCILVRYHGSVFNQINQETRRPQQQSYVSLVSAKKHFIIKVQNMLLREISYEKYSEQLHKRNISAASYPR